MEHHICDSFYYLLWQMESPLVWMADVIAIMADGIAIYRLEYKADVIVFVVDGITTGSYLSMSSMLLIRTSSHTCGRWYLPICIVICLSPISPTTAFTSAFEEFQKSITKEGQKLNTVKPSCYNLRFPFVAN